MKELYAKVMADEGTPPDFKSQLDGLYAKLSSAAPTLISIRPEDPDGEKIDFLKSTPMKLKITP